MNFDEDIVDQIDSLVADATKAVNLFMGPVRGYEDNGTIPHQCIFVTASGGAPTRPIKAGAANNGVQERHPSADIRVRSNPTEGFQAAQSLAREVFDAVQYNPASGYCEWKSASSGPNYLGQDEDGHHEWTFSLEVIYDV